MPKFFEQLAEILEVPATSISLEMDFRKDIDDWDSMKGFSVLILLEDEYGVILDIPDFLSISTVGELFAKVKQ